MRKVYKSLKYSKFGIGLIETLVGGAIGAVMVAGTMKSLQLSLESAIVSRSTLAETDIHHTVSNILRNRADCLANFKPKAQNLPSSTSQPEDKIGLFGADRDWGVGEVVRLVKNASTQTTTDDVIVLEKGKSFKNSLEIVKMEFKGTLPTPKNANNEITKQSATRSLIVHYKKDGMGSHSTVAQGKCQTGTNEDLRGCYSHQCSVTLRLDDTSTSGTDEGRCDGVDCFSSVNGGRGANCYQVDNDSGKERTLVGCGADSAQGLQTVAIGFNAGGVNTGNYNTFLGAKAGGKNTSANANTFVGQAAGQENTTGQSNTFVGTASGRHNTTASHNTFLGDRAGEKNTTGQYNTFVGRYAGTKTTTSHRNTFIGEAAGRDNKTGANNTFVGGGAGILNTTAGGNTFIGRAAGEQVTTAGGNTFIGQEAGKQTTANDPLTTRAEGTANVFVGISAGMRNTTGAENTIIGAYAGLQSSSQYMTGSNNLFLGNRAGKKTTTGSGNIFIGNDAGAEVTTGRDNVYIGNNVGDKSNMHNISNLTNISNRVLMKKSTRTLSDLTFHDNEIRVLGILKVCNETNTNSSCKTVKFFKDVGKCGDGKYLKGFNSDGTKDCQPISYCPQSQHFWSPENICHKCPRDSPLYRENENPACISCPSNHTYILAGTNKNTCRPNCTGGQYWNSGQNRCKCPLETPKWTGSQCEACHWSRPHFWGGECKKCPQNRPYGSGGNNCRACPGAQIKINGVCQCPPGTNPAGGILCQYYP